jgi:glycerophosphoryl diester phosphodiesterase
MSKKQPEYELQVALCRYLSYQYPDVLFLSDTIASLKLTPAQASRNKKIQKVSFSTPDLLILEPRNGYSGLFIELKVETPFKKNGEIKASTNDHLKNQLESIEKLKAKGYFACFSWGFDMTKEIMDNYLKV